MMKFNLSFPLYPCEVIMSENQAIDSALSPYRILDLTEGGCLIGAKILADLGAEVIKIEALECPLFDF